MFGNGNQKRDPYGHVKRDPSRRGPSRGTDPWSSGHTSPDSPVSTSMRDLLSCECHFGTGQFEAPASSAGGTTQLVRVCRSKPKTSHVAADQHPCPVSG